VTKPKVARKARRFGDIDNVQEQLKAELVELKTQDNMD
jgi:hypothetical protein